MADCGYRDAGPLDLEREVESARKRLFPRGAGWTMIGPKAKNDGHVSNSFEIGIFISVLTEVIDSDEISR